MSERVGDVVKTGSFRSDPRVSPGTRRGRYPSSVFLCPAGGQTERCEGPSGLGGHPHTSLDGLCEPTCPSCTQ